MHDLEQLAKIIKRKNAIDDEVAAMTERPALIGHTGEYIASRIFDIKLKKSATHKAIDGVFRNGKIAGKTVNIKWYGKLEGVLDITPETLPDFYLVLTGPKAAATSSRGLTRPWIIAYVFLFDAYELIRNLKVRNRNLTIGRATSIASNFWESAKIYPTQINNDLVVSEAQRKAISLFG